MTFTPKKRAVHLVSHASPGSLTTDPDGRDILFTVSKQTFARVKAAPGSIDLIGLADIGNLSRLSPSMCDQLTSDRWGPIRRPPEHVPEILSEKRPLFIGGSSYALRPSAISAGMFYRRIGRGISEVSIGAEEGSRRCRRPRRHRAKVSGKTNGGLAFGVLQAFTGEERAIVSDSNGVRSEDILEPSTHYNVVRVRQDVLSNSYVGAIFTSVSRTSRRPAYTNGYDWKLRLGGNTYALDGFAALSNTVNRAGERVTGSAGKVSHSRIASEHWLWSSGIDYTSRRYNINDAGFFFAGRLWRSGSVTCQEDAPGAVTGLPSGQYPRAAEFCGRQPLPAVRRERRPPLLELLERRLERELRLWNLQSPGNPGERALS